MSNFTPNIEFDTEFDGDKVKFVMKRLTNAQMMKIGAEAVNASKEQNTTAILSSIQTLVGSREILKDRIESVEGLKDKNGNAISIDVLLDNAYFMQLLDRASRFLIDQSMLLELDAKKSDAPPAGAASTEIST